MCNDIESRIKRIVAEQLMLMIKPEEINNEDDFAKDLGADSLDRVELLMALEEEFKIKIPDEEAEKITTVGEAIEYIKEQIKNRES